MIKILIEPFKCHISFHALYQNVITVNFVSETYFVKNKQNMGHCQFVRTKCVAQQIKYNLFFENI